MYPQLKQKWQNRAEPANHIYEQSEKSENQGPARRRGDCRGRLGRPRGCCHRSSRHLMVRNLMEGCRKVSRRRFRIDDNLFLLT